MSSSALTGVALDSYYVLLCALISRVPATVVERGVMTRARLIFCAVFV